MFEWAIDTLFIECEICTDFVGKFSACYDSGPHRRFSNLHFGVTLTFKLFAGF